MPAVRQNIHHKFTWVYKTKLMIILFKINDNFVGRGNSQGRMAATVTRLIPAVDLCCMSYPSLSLSPHFLSASSKKQ